MTCVTIFFSWVLITYAYGVPSTLLLLLHSVHTVPWGKSNPCVTHEETEAKNGSTASPRSQETPRWVLSTLYDLWANSPIYIFTPHTGYRDSGPQFFLSHLSPRSHPGSPATVHACPRLHWLFGCWGSKCDGTPTWSPRLRWEQAYKLVLTMQDALVETKCIKHYPRASGNGYNNHHLLSTYHLPGTALIF